VTDELATLEGGQPVEQDSSRQRWAVSPWNKWAAASAVTPTTNQRPGIGEPQHVPAFAYSLCLFTAQVGHSIILVHHSAVGNCAFGVAAACVWNGL